MPLAIKRDKSNRPKEGEHENGGSLRTTITSALQTVTDYFVLISVYHDTFVVRLCCRSIGVPLSTSSGHIGNYKNVW